LCAIHHRLDLIDSMLADGLRLDGDVARARLRRCHDFDFDGALRDDISTDILRFFGEACSARGALAGLGRRFSAACGHPIGGDSKSRAVRGALTPIHSVLMQGDIAVSFERFRQGCALRRRPVSQGIKNKTARLVIASTFVCAALSASAGPLTIRVQPVSGETQLQGHLIVESCPDELCSTVTTRTVAELHYPDASTVDVAGTARITVEVAGHWAAPLIAHSGDAVILPLWRKGVVKGSLQVGRGEHLPSTVTLTIRSAPSEKPEVPETEQSCSVVDNRWSCAVPATTLDLRLAAGDFIPAYFWNVHTATPADLGTVMLTRGASVSGRVQAADSQLKGVKVSLRLASDAVTPSLNKFDAIPNARGFFQFRGIPRGVYRVEASRPGASTARVSGIGVTQGREYAIDRPLLIQPLVTFDLLISPPVQPGGERPWIVTLDRLEPSGTTDSVTSSAASLIGEWTIRNLPDGDYSIGVKNSDGAVFLRRRIHVEPSMAPVFVSLDLVPIRGRVHMGDKGIRAAVLLRGREADTSSSVRFKTNADGEFEGTVPHEGRWQVALDLENGGRQIRRPDVTIARSDVGPTRLDFDLPDGRVHGIVVDSEHNPAVAFVSVTRDQRLVAEVKTEVDGSFDFVALDQGDVIVEARSEEGASGTMTVRADRDAAPFEVVLHKKRKLIGRIETRAGYPIAGALLHYAGDAFTDVRRTFSDPEGKVLIEIPDATTTLTVSALAPGFGSIVNTMPVPSSSAPLDIILDEDAGILALNMGATPPWPYIRSQTSSFMSVAFLTYPPDMRSSADFGPEGRYYRMAPGTYVVCRAPVESDQCVTRTVTGGKLAVINIRQAP